MKPAPSLLYCLVGLILSAMASAQPEFVLRILEPAGIISSGQQ